MALKRRKQVKHLRSKPVKLNHSFYNYCQKADQKRQVKFKKIKKRLKFQKKIMNKIVSNSVTIEKDNLEETEIQTNKVQELADLQKCATGIYQSKNLPAESQTDEKISPEPKQLETDASKITHHQRSSMTKNDPGNLEKHSQQTKYLALDNRKEARKLENLSKKKIPIECQTDENNSVEPKHLETNGSKIKHQQISLGKKVKQFENPETHLRENKILVLERKKHCQKKLSMERREPKVIKVKNERNHLQAAKPFVKKRDNEEPLQEAKHCEQIVFKGEGAEETYLQGTSHLKQKLSIRKRKLNVYEIENINQDSEQAGCSKQFDSEVKEDKIARKQKFSLLQKEPEENAKDDPKEISNFKNCYKPPLRNTETKKSSKMKRIKKFRPGSEWLVSKIESP